MSKDKDLDAGRPAIAGHSPGPWRWDYAGLRGGPLDRPLIEAVYDRERDMRVRVNNEADAALISHAPELLAMLRELEWAGGDVSGGGCPECGDCHPNKTHTPDCRLAKLLGELT